MEGIGSHDSAGSTFMELVEIGEHYMASKFGTAVVKRLCLMDSGDDLTMLGRED